jgi:hypothetical protein
MPLTNCIVCGWLERFRSDTEADWSAAKDYLAAFEKSQNKFELDKRRAVEEKARDGALFSYFQIDLHRELHHDPRPIVH